MQIKKIPLALAIGAAFATPLASAQATTVQIYGKLYPYIERESGSGPSAPGTPVSTLSAAPTGVLGVPAIRGMSAGNSNIGFRGTEDMGDGLKAIFQLEGVVSIDNGVGGQWNRNTFAGVAGNFGTVKLGLMDTVLKEYGDTLGILGISSGTPVSSSNILRKSGFGTSNNARFHERRANSIRYDSPEIGGLQAGLQVATQEGPVVATVPGSAKTYSMGVKYDNGPIYAALAYEIHDNWFGGSSNAPAAQRNSGSASATSKDKALQAAVEWRITKEHTVEFDVIRKTYDEPAIANGRFQNYKNMAYMIAYDGRFGLFRTMAHYVKSSAGSCSLLNATCTTTGLGASQLTAGVGYYLSKRTFLYGVFSQMTNGAASRFSASDFGTPNPGEDVRHLMAGISHNF